MKTKLLLISETVKEGVGKHIIDLITNLDRERFEIHLIHSSKRTDIHFQKTKHELANVVYFYEVEELVREINPIKDLRALLRIKKIIKKVKPNIIHSHSSKAGVLGRLAAFTEGVKTTYYTPHAYAAQNKKNRPIKNLIYSTIERIFALCFTTKTINVSDGEKQFAISNKILKEDKAKVIYNSISIETKLTKSSEIVKSELNLNPTDVIIGCVARIYEQKNPFEYVNIAREVISKHSNCVFLWVGNGEQKELVESYVKNLGLSDKILFIGFREDIDNYLNIFDIYLSTSLYEGLPYTLIEALRSKLPIVASNVIGNNEVVIDNSNGYLYELEDSATASNRITMLIKNESLRDELGNTAYNYFINNFTLDKMIKEHEKLYLQG